MYHVKILQGEQEEEIVVPEGQRLIECLWGKIDAPCAGKGICGKCRMEVLTGKGWKEQLACHTQVDRDLIVRLPQIKKEEQMQAGTARRIGIAVDLGTTTIAVYLVDLEDGQVKATFSEENAQKAYGADVVSRIEYSGRRGTEELQKVICKQLWSMICRISVREPERVVIAGNTVMNHLLLGKDPSGLAAYPFEPQFLEGQRCKASRFGWDGAFEVLIMPSISAYIGGDITASILACGIHKTDRTELLIDLGTNGEMVLSHQGRLYATSVAVGPAFEGSHIACGTAGIPGAVDHVHLERGLVEITTIEQKPSLGICGNGLVETAASLLEQGIMDHNGKLKEKLLQPPVWRKYIQGSGKKILFRLTPQLFISQQDIRQLQYAKAAVAAGIQVLLEQAGGAADKVYLAGGFGSYLSRESAVRIGLLPEKLLKLIRASGNTSGKGAVLVLRQPELFAEAEHLRERVQVLELGGDPRFEELYLSHMNF